MPSFLCLEWVSGYCGQGLRRAGGAQPVPALTGALQTSDPPQDCGKMPQVALSNLKVYLIRKRAGFPFHFLAVCLGFF